MTSKDPLVNTRSKFALNYDESIKAINAGTSEGKFYKKHGDKFVLVCRNGNTAMKLGETTHYEVPNPEKAVIFLQAAKQAAESGELDKLFQATKRTKKAKTTA